VVDCALVGKMNQAQTEVRQGPGEWTAELETLNLCPVCASKNRVLAFGNMRDIVFGVAPGSWRLYRCGDCDTYYLDPRPSRKSVMLAYDEYFTHAVDDHNSLAFPSSRLRKLRNDYLAWRLGYELPRNQPLGRWLFRFLPVRRRRYERLVRDFPAPTGPARLLDIGCGSGEFLARMREVGWTVVGHDLDPKAVQTARSRGIDVVLGPLDSKSFDGKFDAITMHHVIEHVHDPVETLKICRELLAPGGRLWIATPNADSLGRRRFGAHWVGLDSPRHLIVFSRKSLDLALRRAGFPNPSVRPDIGMYGSTATSAGLHRREAAGLSIGRLRIHVENVIGDAVMLLVAGMGDELIATADL
jgi:2-polyprenyl-3-methyl-5-hydroxy-6-metoxy-1,4-benzoquinol methylase